MTDYRKYSCNRMLQYIEKRSAELEVNNHIDYILSMENENSIEDIIKIYNHAYQFLAILFFGTKKVPIGWYKPETWGYRNTYLVEDLNHYFNESIWSWYKRQEEATDEKALKCICNLRYSSNKEKIQYKILKNSNPQADKGIKYLIYLRDRQYNLRKQLESYCKNRTTLKSEYISCSKYLAAHDRVFDVVEIAFGKEIGITYDNYVELYKEQVAQEEKRMEEKRKRLKDEKREQIISHIGAGVILLIIVIIASYILNLFGALLIFPIFFYLIGLCLLAL